MNRGQQFLVLMLVLAGCSTLRGQEPSGWSFPNLNPWNWGRNADRGRAALSDDESRGMFSLPKLGMPKLPRIGPSQSAARPAAAGVNPLQRMGQGAVGLLTKTKDALTRPFARGQRNQPPTIPHTGGRRQGPSGRFFRSRPAPPDEPRDPVDFLKQPRVAP